jgi:hypothetical protein
MPLLPRSIKTFSRPICSNCKTKMLFVWASKEQPGFMQRAFECPQCGYAETDIVKVGPAFKTRDIKRQIA